MEHLLSLWLPIILSAVAVFIASALAWMALPHHKADFGMLPPAAEESIMAAVRSSNLKPGMYGFPDCQDKTKMNDPAFKAKLEAGPVGMVNVMPPGAYTNMGGKMVWSFIVYLLISIFVAYVGTLAHTVGDSFSDIFQVTGTVAIMAYVFGRLPNDIWFSTPRRAIVTNLIDGIAYGLITGLIFAWLWRQAA